MPSLATLRLATRRGLGGWFPSALHDAPWRGCLRTRAVSRGHRPAGAVLWAVVVGHCERTGHDETLRAAATLSLCSRDAKRSVTSEGFRDHATGTDCRADGDETRGARHFPGGGWASPQRDAADLRALGAR